MEAIKLIRQFVEHVEKESFIKDIKIQSAVQYQFLVIGEAVRYIDNSILEKYTYPWHIPRAFRNFMINVYHDVKLERIYHAAKDLEALEQQIRLIVENEFN